MATKGSASGHFKVGIVPFDSHADTDVMVPIHIRAYEGSDSEKMQFPNGPEPDFIRYLYEKAMVKDESCIAVVAKSLNDLEIDAANIPKGTILGFAVWIDRSMVPAKPPTEEEMTRAPKSGDPDFGRIWHERCFSKEQEYVGDMPHVRLLNLIVDPIAQGRKIGGALLDACLQYAHERQQAVYLEASKEGEPVYRSRGFENAGEIVLDTPLSRSKGLSATIVCMLKKYEA